jgi:hypothetical protein
MAQSRAQDREASAKRTRRKSLVKTGAKGTHVRLKAGEDVTEIVVSKGRYRRIVGKGRIVGMMISGYADVAAKAKKTGRTYVITYRVTPDGKAEALAEAPADKAADDPLAAALARAKVRGATKVTEILKGEDMLTARDFGPLIGASHETVNIKRKRHEVLGLEGTTRGVRYPRWQVTDAGLPLPGLARLFDALGEQPWTVYRFLRTAHAELGGRTALDALKVGQVDAVLGVAENQASGTFT